jgi:hypothetical protein
MVKVGSNSGNPNWRGHPIMLVSVLVPVFPKANLLDAGPFMMDGCRLLICAHQLSVILARKLLGLAADFILKKPWRGLPTKIAASVRYECFGVLRKDYRIRGSDFRCTHSR